MQALAIVVVGHAADDSQTILPWGDGEGVGEEGRDGEGRGGRGEEDIFKLSRFLRHCLFVVMLLSFWCRVFVIFSVIVLSCLRHVVVIVLSFVFCHLLVVLSAPVIWVVMFCHFPMCWLRK